MPLNINLDPKAKPLVMPIKKNKTNVLGYSANFANSSGTGSNKQLNKINAKIKNVQNKIKQYNKNMYELRSKRNLGGLFKEQFNTARIEKHKLIKRVTRLEKNKEIYKNLSKKLRATNNKSEKMRLGKQRNEVLKKIMNINSRTPPSRSNSASSMMTKNTLAKAANVVTGIPVQTLKQNMTKQELSGVVTGVPAGMRRRRVGPFGGVWYENYDPSANIREKARRSVTGGVSKISRGWLTKTGGLLSGVGRRFTSAGETRAQRANNIKQKRQNIKQKRGWFW